MGTALMMEGLLSACYHVCPNYTNFQFGELTWVWSRLKVALMTRLLVLCVQTPLSCT